MINDSCDMIQPSSFMHENLHGSLSGNNICMMCVFVCLFYCQSPILYEYLTDKCLFLIRGNDFECFIPKA